jgi:EAL domain-containing protein (putative c-di-GMP-specific phosphodiesterase class I)/CheY-like chemotaxis protein
MIEDGKGLKLELQDLPINKKNGKPVIVCVDDEEMILSSLRFQIKKFFKEFFQVEIATNAEIALEILAECNEKEIEVPLIISDHIMPGIKGDELLIRVSKLNPKTKKIMLTGQANADAVGNALNQAGLYRFIAKPWDPEDLNLTLQEAIRSFYMDKSLEQKNKDLEHALFFNHRTDLPNLESLQKRIQELGQSRFHLTLLKLDNYLPCMRAFGLELYHKLVNRFTEIFFQNLDEKLYHIYEDEFALITQIPEDILISKLNAFRLLLKSDLVAVDEILFQLNITIASISNLEPEEDIYQKARVVLIASYEKATRNLVQHNFDMNEQDLHSYNCSWGKKLNYSLQDKRIIPYYQGVLNNRTGKIQKYECLARMVEDDIIYPPSKFLEIARSTGTLKSITRMIIEKSVKLFATNTHSFSINITEAELEDRGFVKYIESSLNFHKIEPARVIFEVLENITLQPESQQIKTIADLKELGCRISIDDFGVSNSNLSRILEFYPDYIKIDGKFIKNLLNNKNAYIITKIIKELSFNIGAMTIAEYVCDKEIQAAVNSLGIDFSQGYYIMEPSPNLQ